MRILTLNIRQGGGTRVARIVAAVERHSPDVTILTEFRLGPTGEILRNLLADAGFVHQAHGNPPAKTNSVLVASRLPLSTAELAIPHHRLVSVQAEDLNVTGVYLPLSRPKVEFWTNYFQLALDQLRDQAAVVVGDFNTGDDRDRESKAMFYAESLFKGNLAGSWVDAWHSLQGEQRDYTWRSHVGNGFLIDHLWLSASAKHRLKSAFISHTEQDDGVSDHAALVVDLAN